jgi:membrane-associated phospholipid phosphatase
MLPQERSPARDLAGMGVGLGVLIGSALVARRPRGGSEIELFRSANDLPNEAFPAVWAAMQYGTFGAVPAAAIVALLARKPRLAGSLAVGGTAAWVTAKAAKRIVARGRPASIIGDVRQRGAEEGDQGFPSGHAAVSTAMTVIMWPEASPRMRLTLSTLTGLVPFGRMYVGAHLPLDLVGGSALGLALGSTVNLVRGRRSPAPEEPATLPSR